MNTTKIKTLLQQWADLINISEQVSKKKANQNSSGLSGRIQRTTGRPVIFDFETHENQQTIQNSLCQELPQYANIIRSQPEIMDGYPWTRNDFIELYFEHFRLVVEKLQQIIDRAIVV